MGNSIYMYLKQEDYDELISLMSANHGTMISTKGKVLMKPRFDSIDDHIFYVCSSASLQTGIGFDQICFWKHIRVTQQSLLGGMLQPMCLSLESGHQNALVDDEMNLLYNTIKKYIKKHYVISTDKMNYMGPCAFSDWEKRLFNTPLLFLNERSIFNLSQKEFELFLEWAEARFKVIDYTTRSYIQGKRIYEHELYCITNSMANIIKRFTRIKTIRIDTDSKCIFVRRELAGKKRTFVYIDKRIINEQDYNITRIYDMVVSFLANFSQISLQSCDA